MCYSGHASGGAFPEGQEAFGPPYAFGVFAGWSEIELSGFFTAPTQARCLCLFLLFDERLKIDNAHLQPSSLERAKTATRSSCKIELPKRCLQLAQRVTTPFRLIRDTLEQAVASPSGT